MDGDLRIDGDSRLDKVDLHKRLESSEGAAFPSLTIDTSEGTSMNGRALLRVAAATMLAVTITSALTPSPAQAVFDCPDNGVCFYHDQNFRGTVAVLPELQQGHPLYTNNVRDFSTRAYTNRTNLNDSISSIVNNTGLTLCVYEHAARQYGGWRLRIPGGTAGTFVAGDRYNDNASSATLGVTRPDDTCVTDFPWD